MAPTVTIGDATDAELEWEKEVRTRLQAEDEARERRRLRRGLSSRRLKPADGGRIQQRQPAEERTPERRELEHVEEQDRPPAKPAAEPPLTSTPNIHNRASRQSETRGPHGPYRHLGRPVPYASGQ